MVVGEGGGEWEGRWRCGWEGEGVVGRIMVMAVVVIVMVVVVVSEDKREISASQLRCRGVILTFG